MSGLFFFFPQMAKLRPIFNLISKPHAHTLSELLDPNAFLFDKLVEVLIGTQKHGAL